ncbi:MAG: hypothetical protein AB1432_04900 [Bacteroidota bacterium]
MIIFDLAISYTWEYDKEFITLLEKKFQKSGYKTFIIYKQNLDEVAFQLRNKMLHFKAYLDRASDEDPDFEVISKLLSKKSSYLINPHNKTKKVTDKAYFHKRLLGENFNLPKTIILKPYDQCSSLFLSEADLNELKIPFIIKPALFSGGGQGVVKNGTSLEQIQVERIKSHSEKYLIQEKIQPVRIDHKRGWFRVFWAFGKVIPTWWDDQTHIYNPVTKEQINRFNLQQLIIIATKLARIASIDYFSTEIALTRNNRFVLIDYINDQCDLRLQSLHADGVADIVVNQFIDQLKRKVASL